MSDIKNKDAMETNEKISQLQGLRGVAMLGIFIMHTFVFYTDSGGGKDHDFCKSVRNNRCNRVFYA